jgi:hypothetical protein
MNIESLSSGQLRRAAGIKGQIEKLQTELGRILGSTAQPRGAGRKRRRKMSASARAKIAAAARARWARVRAGKK